MRLTPLVSLLALGLALTLPRTAAAQGPEGVSVAYRLRGGTTLHFTDAAKAREHLAAVRQLGCEARAENHDGHVDVTYRLVEWRHIAAASHPLAHGWEAWLKRAGFETLHGHPEDAAGHDHAGHGHAGHGHAGHDHAGHRHGTGPVEAVSYRLVGWATKQFADVAEARQFASVARAFGCEVREGRHDGRFDVAFRCAAPHRAEFASHAVAEAWERWLRDFGFETRHVH
jgi:hypothetical protein